MDQFQSSTNRGAVMAQKKREAFLAEPRIGVMSMTRKSLAPLSMPVCYSYEPGGEVRVFMDATSFKAKLVERTGRYTLCVQDDAPPYRFVTVEGPARLEPAESKRDAPPILCPSLGERRAMKYIETFVEHGLVACIAAMRPEHWWSWDLGQEDHWQEIMAVPAD